MYNRFLTNYDISNLHWEKNGIIWPKSWVTGGTKFLPGILSNWRIFKPNWLNIDSQFIRKNSQKKLLLKKFKLFKKIKHQSVATDSEWDAPPNHADTKLTKEVSAPHGRYRVVHKAILPLTFIRVRPQRRTRTKVRVCVRVRRPPTMLDFCTSYACTKVRGSFIQMSLLSSFPPQ